MAKKSLLKKETEREEHEFDFSDMLESCCDNEDMNMIIENVIEASHHQMRIAFDLTKLVVERSNSVSEEAILSVFKKASIIVAETSPFKSLWEKMN